MDTDACFGHPCPFSLPVATILSRRGDEQADTYTSDVRSSLKNYAEVMQQAGNAELAQALLLIESLYAGFYVDSPSADNTLGIAY